LTIPLTTSSVYDTSGIGTSAVLPKTAVLFLSSPEQLGADTFIHVMLMRRLNRSRFEVHAACPAGEPHARTPTFKTLTAIPDLHLRPSNFGPSLTGRSRPAKVALLLRAVPVIADWIALIGYIRRHRITVLHSTDRPRDALSCVLLGKLTGARSVVHVHVKCSDWMSRSVLWAMAHADALVGVSRFVVSSLVAHGFRAETTHAVLNAIDAADWDDGLDPGPIRRELNLPPGAPVVACVARLFHWKGQADLVRAIAIVGRELPDLRLLIVGQDDRMVSSVSCTAQLQQLVQDLGLGNQVIFMGQRADVAAILAASDVFALPSFEEPFGLVFLEALAMKKPVVALDNGGTPEVVEHQKSGLLSAPGDIEALAANLLVLLRDPVTRARMGEYGRRQVETRFTPAQLARDIEQVYSTLARPDAKYARA
jgi:glycosyltransferase involved in cell wall biosynthesis